VANTPDRPLRFAMVGAGFWARYQLAAWKEVPEAECVAVCDRMRERAERLAMSLGVMRVYDDTARMLEQERVDFVDIVTDPPSHPELVRLVADHGIAVVCQKPLALSLEEAEALVDYCHSRGVRLIVHENWRWQVPIRALRRMLDGGVIGRPFYGEIRFCTSFPVFQNQPYLRTLERFALADVGVHLLDVARFFFGEADRLYCQTHRVDPDIRGEDVAIVVLRMNTTTVVCRMSFASRLSEERFPQTFCTIEGDRGSLELGPDYWIRTTTAEGTWARRFPPPSYPWVDPLYEVVQASMVPCNAHILHALRTGEPAETEAEDNLKTLRLVFAAYDSASRGQVRSLP
jgi:predicted dehydrogenase